MAELKYYVNMNAQPNGDHEVHTEKCHKLPAVGNRTYLGQFSNCHPAVRKAKKEHYKQSDGCIHCCKECHTS